MQVVVSLAGRCLRLVVNGDETYNFKLLLAGWGGNLDFIANLAVQQRLADGRGSGDEAFFNVGLFAADELARCGR